MYIGMGVDGGRWGLYIICIIKEWCEKAGRINKRVRVGRCVRVCYGQICFEN